MHWSSESLRRAAISIPSQISVLCILVCMPHTHTHAHARTYVTVRTRNKQTAMLPTPATLFATLRTLLPPAHVHCFSYTSSSAHTSASEASNACTKCAVCWFALLLCFFASLIHLLLYSHSSSETAIVGVRKTKIKQKQIDQMKAPNSG